MLFLRGFAADCYDIYCSRHLHITAEIYDPGLPVCVHFVGRVNTRVTAGALGERHGFNIVSVTCEQGDWYQYPDVGAAQEALRRALAPFPRTVLLGSSMGAYAALHWSGPLQASAVLAFAPQASIGAACPPADTRWAEHHDRIAQAFGYREDLAATISPSAEIVIVYDPHHLDAQHVALIAAIRPVHRLRVPLTGHGTIQALAPTGVVSRLIRVLLGGRFEPAAWQVEVRRSLGPDRRLLAVALGRFRRSRHVNPTHVRQLVWAGRVRGWGELARLFRMAVRVGLADETAALAYRLADFDDFVRSGPFQTDIARAIPLLRQAGAAAPFATLLVERAHALHHLSERTPEQALVQAAVRTLGHDAAAAAEVGRTVVQDRHRQKKAALLLAAGRIFVATGCRPEGLRAAQDAAAVLNAWDGENGLLASLFFSLGEPARGIAMARRAIACDPVSLQAYGLIAGHHEAARDWEAAAEIWREALAAGADAAKASGRLGLALLKLARFQEAYDLLAPTLAADPVSAALLRPAADSLMRLGRPADAAALLRRLLGEAPGDARAHQMLSECLHKLGLLDQAIASARRAVELSPATARYAVHLERLERRRARPEPAAAVPRQRRLV